MRRRALGQALVVGVDMATKDVRAVCADGAGFVRARASAALPPPRRPRPGWSEQDATQWWPAAAAALRGVTSKLGDQVRAVRAIAVSATSGTVLVADAAGEPLGPALLYDDQRAVDEADVAQTAGQTRWAALGLRIGPSFGLPKWAWLLRQARRGAAGAPPAVVWHASDLVVSRLTSTFPLTDWSHALKSGYDPLHREWAVEVMEALGVATRLLPAVAAPGHRVGTVSDDAASETGLPPGCEVRLGMTDGCAAQLAAGADLPGRFATVVGTTLVVKGGCDAPVADGSGALYSHRHPQGWWLPGGASNTGGRALADRFPGADLEALDRRAALHGPARCVTYPLVGRGERFPFVAPGAESMWDGAPGDDVERYRAILEGVAFVERLSYAHLAGLGVRVEPPIAAAGGGSRSPVWSRLRASVLGVPLAVAANGDTAFGACVLAAAGTLHPDVTTAVGEMVAVTQQVDPDPAEAGRLEASYVRFVGALSERGWLPAPLSAGSQRTPW